MDVVFEAAFGDAVAGEELSVLVAVQVLIVRCDFIFLIVACLNKPDRFLFLVDLEGLLLVAFERVVDFVGGAIAAALQNPGIVAREVCLRFVVWLVSVRVCFVIVALGVASD